MTPWDEEKSLYRMELRLDIKEAFRTGWSRGLRDKSRGLHILVQCLLGFKNAFVDYDIPQVEKLSVKRLKQLRLRQSDKLVQARQIISRLMEIGTDPEELHEMVRQCSLEQIHDS